MLQHLLKWSGGLLLKFLLQEAKKNSIGFKSRQQEWFEFLLLQVSIGCLWCMHFWPVLQNHQIILLHNFLDVLVQHLTIEHTVHHITSLEKSKKLWPVSTDSGKSHDFARLGVSFSKSLCSLGIHPRDACLDSTNRLALIASLFFKVSNIFQESVHVLSPHNGTRLLEGGSWLGFVHPGVPTVGQGEPWEGTN